MSLGMTPYSLITTILLLIFSLDSYYLCEGKTSECGNEWKSSSQCYGKELERYLNDKPAWTGHVSKISSCFNESKCEIPSYDRNPLSDLPKFMRKLGKKIRDEWASTSNAVKQCVKERFGGSVLDEMKKCLTKKGINNATISRYINESDHGNSFADMILGGGEKGNDSEHKTSSQGTKKALITLVNVVHSMRVCNESHGGTSGLETCVKGEYAAVKKAYCNRTGSCDQRNATSTKSSCLADGLNLYEAMCECKQENVRLLLNKLNQITAKERENVTMYDLFHAFSQGYNVSEYLTAVRQCYRSNKERMPKFVAATVGFMQSFADNGNKTTKENQNSDQAHSSKNSGKNAKSEDDGESDNDGSMPVDPKFLDIVRDFLASQAFDEDECKRCNKE